MRFAVILLALAAVSATGTQAQQPPDTGRTILLIIDDLHLDFRLTPRIRDLLKRLMTGFRESDRISVVSTGYSSISERPTLDRKVVESAINRVTGGGFRPAELIGPTALPQRDVEVRHRIHVSLSTADDAIRSLERAGPGPRIVIFVSNGFQLPADLRRELQELARTITLADARLYAVWPLGLVDVRLLQAPDTEEWRRYLLDTVEGLRMLTAPTGGLTIVDPLGLENALNAIR